MKWPRAAAEWKPILEKVVDTLQKGPDLFLLKSDVSERAIAARVARTLETELQGGQKALPDSIAVDVEYNRALKEGGPYGAKVVAIPAKDAEDFREVSAYPDIIVHRRGCNCSNLLVIEVKKGHPPRRLPPMGPEAIVHDHDKLCAYTRDLNYSAGVLLFLGVSEHRGTWASWWYEGDALVGCCRYPGECDPLDAGALVTGRTNPKTCPTCNQLPA